MVSPSPKGSPEMAMETTWTADTSWKQLKPPGPSVASFCRARDHVNLPESLSTRSCSVMCTPAEHKAFVTFVVSRCFKDFSTGGDVSWWEQNGTQPTSTDHFEVPEDVVVNSFFILVVPFEAMHFGLVAAHLNTQSHTLPEGVPEVQNPAAESSAILQPSSFIMQWVCLKIVYPIVPNGFADHYPY